MIRSNDQLIKEGHLAIRRGDKNEARQLLEQATRQDPGDYRAWLALAAVSKTPQQSMAMIEKAAAITPDNPAVLKARKWAAGLAGPAVSPPATSKPAVESVRPMPKPENQTPKTVRVPLESTAVNQRSFGRRVVRGAAFLGLIIALGILAWYGWYNGFDIGSILDFAAVESTENNGLAGVGLVPEAEISSIVADQEPPIAAVESSTATPNPIQPKNIIQELSESRPRWTATPPPTPTVTPSPTWVPTFVSPISEAGILKPLGLLPSERWIDVDLSTQALVAFEGDTPVFETLVSSGMYQYPTVTGQFRIWLRYESQTMDGSRLGYDYFLENVQWVQYFYEDYALHGTYWHNNFGTPMSHGCVNLSNTDAQFLFDFANLGTVVNVHD